MMAEKTWCKGGTSMVTVSIIVPMYKVEKYLERCLDSLINQTFQDIEIICVDDGSPDKSGEIAERYAIQDKRIKVIHKKNAGLGMARNTGIEAASGKFIAFVDSDDYLEKTMIQALIDAAVRVNADTAIGGYSRNSNGQIQAIDNPISGRVFHKETIATSVLARMVGPSSKKNDAINMAAWRVLYSLELIKKNNLRYPSEREFISEDIIFDIEYYSKAECVCGVENSGYIYCQNAGSLTEKYNPERYEKGEILFHEKCRLLDNNGILDDDMQNRAEESFLNYSRYAIKSEARYAHTNGFLLARTNIKKIGKSKELRRLIYAHSKSKKSKIDWLIDSLLKLNGYTLITIILAVGYWVRNND